MFQTETDVLLPSLDSIAVGQDDNDILRYWEVAAGDSEFVLDNLGNVMGGIRTLYVDAPSAILSGLGQTGGSFCGLFGTTDLFDAATMASLYVDQAGFVAAVTQAADSAVNSGFLQRTDADQIIAWAPQQWNMQVP